MCILVGCASSDFESNEFTTKKTHNDYVTTEHYNFELNSPIKETDDDLNEEYITEIITHIPEEQQQVRPSEDISADDTSDKSSNEDMLNLNIWRIQVPDVESLYNDINSKLSSDDWDYTIDAYNETFVLIIPKMPGLSLADISFIDAYDAKEYKVRDGIYYRCNPVGDCIGIPLCRYDAYSLYYTDRSEWACSNWGCIHYTTPTCTSPTSEIVFDFKDKAHPDLTVVNNTLCEYTNDLILVEIVIKSDYLELKYHIGIIDCLQLI